MNLNDMLLKAHKYEHTGILCDGSVIHYTCNAPNGRILGKYGIKPVNGLKAGDTSLDDSLFVIPGSVFIKFGYPIDHSTDRNVLKITAENLLRRLG